MSDFDLSVLFFLQLAVILVVCRATGMLFVRLGQSQVVAEMIAGVLLGPSFLGLLAPALQARLFPPDSNTILYAVAQVGLALYMFTIGVEFDLGLIRTRLRSAVAISLAGILAPFAIGAAVAQFLHGDALYFSPTSSSLEAALFLGASMSITAFPMLARIIHERGLAGTSLGTLALAAGSIDDAAAWCVLAIVLASFQGDPRLALIAIGGGCAYALFVLLVVRRLLVPLGRKVERAGELGPATLTLVLGLCMLGAWFTDRIHIYAVFGAFLMGIAMPRGHFARELMRVIEPLTKSLLLPLFFVYSGLNTRIGLVNTSELWMLAATIVLLACLGKGVACYVAARANGEPTRSALAIGTLMNARGLMELIILNIGLERGIIQPTLFTIMVLMAVVTTLMATPVFERVWRAEPARS